MKDSDMTWLLPFLVATLVVRPDKLACVARPWPHRSKKCWWEEWWTRSFGEKIFFMNFHSSHVHSFSLFSYCHKGGVFFLSWLVYIITFISCISAYFMGVDPTRCSGAEAEKFELHHWSRVVGGEVTWRSRCDTKKDCKDSRLMLICWWCCYYWFFMNQLRMLPISHCFHQPAAFCDSPLLSQP